jgi:hypothetical protein
MHCVYGIRYAIQSCFGKQPWSVIAYSLLFLTLSHQEQVLFLNKHELFENKIRTSRIKDYFPVRSKSPAGGNNVDILLQDYGGRIGDALEGVEYFKKRFRRLAQKSHRTKEREVYVQYGVISVSLVLHSDQSSSKCHNVHGSWNIASPVLRVGRCVNCNAVGLAH